MASYKKNAWYKVYYRFRSDFSGEYFTTFVYRMNTDNNPDSIENTENFIKNSDDYTFVKTEEWIIK